MARSLVCARRVLLALACALGPAAAAEVNYSLHLGTRVWDGDVTVFELGGGVGGQHQFDLGPATWDWRPELALAGGSEILGDNGQGEFALGVARRWRKDDTELRLSVGAVRLEAHDDHGGLAIFGLDITERKDAESALREAQERTNRILDGIADTYYSLDARWRLVTVNPAAEKAPFGRPASELLGRVIWDLYPELIGTRIHQHYLDAAEKNRTERKVFAVDRIVITLETRSRSGGN